ncbi:MAG: hypothetical protein AB2693_06290 [Candidatus Thiodiazotropha sp.]
MAKQDIDAGTAFQHLSAQMAASGEAYAALTNQMSNLTSAIGAHGISQFITPFEGEPAKFKPWVKSIEKYALLTKLTDERTIYVAYQSARGGVSDFISRLINVPGQTWANLKAELTARFAEITDHMQAFSLLRKVRQGSTENVQLYAERLLALARDAFEGQDGNNNAVERQLIGFFADGLYHDYLRIKVMRDNPTTFQQAVRSALNEQNLRKRFQLRSGREFGRDRPPTGRQDEPMEVDHYRPPRRCYKCNRPGHTAANCRQRTVQRTNVSAVNISEQEQNANRPRRRPDIVCYRCHKVGHIRAECTTRMGNQSNQGN